MPLGSYWLFDGAEVIRGNLRLLPAERVNETYIRDGYTCRSCGKRPKPYIGNQLGKFCFIEGKLHIAEDIMVDHIIALSDGGTHDLANLQTLCTACHLIKTRKERRDRRLILYQFVFLLKSSSLPPVPTQSKQPAR
jgi:5-methylcytosine-specific restriction endonuclease McrA